MNAYNIRAIVVGVIALAVGTIIMLGIWDRRMQLHHGGSKIPLGKLCTASTALLPGGWGILILWLGMCPRDHIPALGFIAIFILALIGSIYGAALDHRSSAPILQTKSNTQEQKSDAMSPRAARMTGLVLAIALGQFLFLRVNSAWTNYWLFKDVQKGTAIVTKELWSGHNAVAYRYVVGNKEYMGHSGRNSRDAKYSKVQVGEESVVYFSASHPWLSLLEMPRAVLEGLPVIIVVLIFETFAVITVVKPKNGWAFGFAEKDHEHSA